MGSAAFTAGEWFLVAQYELLLFAAVFFLIGALDEMVIDVCFVALRLKKRLRGEGGDAVFRDAGPLRGPVAIFIPAWREAAVIGATLRHAMDAWPQAEVRFYVGCYRNDPDTPAAALAGADGDPRFRLVIHERDGPTSKADCLNCLYDALGLDETRDGVATRMVVLHDAEDMVDPAALGLLDWALDSADFIQLPVLALPRAKSRWIAGHYTDEFAEMHGKTMVVRDALGAAIPGAGVGCAIERAMLRRLAERNGGEPFSTGSLTEDYELGLDVAAMGGRTRFLRVRAPDGRLIATRAYFPARLVEAVRQKTRWVHGIALQSWDRLGWRGGVVDLWMQMRDRRGPFAALLLAVGYALILLSAVQYAGLVFGVLPAIKVSDLLRFLLIANVIAFVWRVVVRGIFTRREFGSREGLFALPRIIVSNIVAIMAGRRALTAYIRTLIGEPVQWEKTEHREHPALAREPTSA